MFVFEPAILYNKVIFNIFSVKSVRFLFRAV